MSETLRTVDVHSLSAHPATADLKPLPLPPLEQTLAQYATALSAVLDDDERAHASRVIEDFSQSKGPLLDATLRDRATTREHEGTNWLHDEWYEGYLAVRGPLQLSTNVGFQLAPLGGEAAGSQRAAAAIQRIATVHLQAASDALPADVDARGNRITLNQWFVFNGGLRHPRPEVDEVAICTKSAAHREIGVFVDGRLFALPISDAEGNITPREYLAANLDTVLAAARTSSPDQADFNAAALSGDVSELTELIEHNPRTYQRLADLLFTVDLINAAGRDDAALLADLAFRPRGAWVYKPLSYQLGLDSDWTAVHVEHTCQDGGTLVTAVSRMQDAQVQESSTLSKHAAEELRWDLDHTPNTPATPYTVELHTIDIPPTDLPFKFSRDASAQLTMTIAQQLTYGRVRAVYEAVDMREYRAGRTECLRALTPEAAAFARALVAGTATREQLVAAADAHRGWVKRCKSGNGIDRHIQMLEHLDAHETDAFFRDPVVTAARKDFLSTTSVGSASQIVRYAFAPTLPEGFGIAYTPHATATEYCVSYNTDTAEKPQEFLANLARASELLWQFCGELDG
ncbi:choline/carnitine O-acyltransferase [Corynebacterium sp. HMSC074A01]|uniref:choline/carnitine O-acyltransferase n=1 Tax=Corynebacterium sp. HMSC074A01 TaxID=1715030 RepID=UPI000B1D35EE|nr:choline/carnitine O-acyltransferase [Corynebacterium sp. HMSC074A01]